MRYKPAQPGNYIQWWLVLFTSILAALILNGLLTFLAVREYIKASIPKPSTEYKYSK